VISHSADEPSRPRNQLCANSSLQNPSLPHIPILIPLDFFDLPIDEAEFVLVDRSTDEKAPRQVAGGEVCRGDEADIPFDWILDRVTGREPAVTDYVLECLLRCRYCGGDIAGKMLVEPETED
jgi:hypothetical protein